YISYGNTLLQGVNIFADRISFQNVQMQQTGENGITSVQGNGITSNQDNRRTSAQSNVRDANCTPVRGNVMDQNAVAVSHGYSAVGASINAGTAEYNNPSLVVSCREN